MGKKKNTYVEKDSADSTSGGAGLPKQEKAEPNDVDVVGLGREVISREIEGLEELRRGIGRQFERAVALLLESRGKVIVCGIGKSGIVARKIAATLSSTGTPAVYLHPVEATHGDMGMITEDDIFLAVSKSGGNEEISKLIPYLRTMNVKVITITTNSDSVLAGESDVLLDTGAGREACSMDVVPTTSTTAALVLGDALAVAVLESRSFDKEDFAKLHPSGVLGRRLLVTVGELMHKDEDVPAVDMDTTLRVALIEIINKRLGCTGITDGEGRLAGIITDGDLKRILVKNPDALDVPVSEVMTRSPRTAQTHILAVHALEQMEMNEQGPITQLFVVDKDERPIGLIHIHDILRAGLK